MSQMISPPEVNAKKISLIKLINAKVLRHSRIIELVAVIMRIFSFSLVSWLGPDSPFMFVWIFNTIDATLLSWCAILKRDGPYMLLNTFWIFVGIVGIARAGGWLGSPGAELGSLAS